MADLQLKAATTNGGHDSTQSFERDSGASPKSQTASDYIDSQLRLEADAREALPYSFDHCTQPLGPLRQNLFSCLTCNPPPASPSDPFTPAAVCYSCSIACHVDHTLVELFSRRNFICDCGTTRLPVDNPCTLRINPETGMKGPVHSQEAAGDNTYNQNCRNRFCGCGEWYDAHTEKGTMFQCLGLAQESQEGCGEDWWHPECVMGLDRAPSKLKNDASEAVNSNGGDDNRQAEEVERPLPQGFPAEDDFEAFICYKCVEANPWIKRYAGTAGFLGPVYNREEAGPTTGNDTVNITSPDVSLAHTNGTTSLNSAAGTNPGNAGEQKDLRLSSPRKRPVEDAELDTDSVETKRSRTEPDTGVGSAYHVSLPSAPSGQFSLFLKEDFRDHFCRCRDCYPVLSKYPQLLEEEETYEPPLSESGNGDDGQSKGTGSLLERGEAALSNVDRVRAIEGVMVYNHLKDKVKAFLQPFAESGQAVGAEDIKAYFEKLRGDEQGIKEAGAATHGGSDGDEGASRDNRREQNGQHHDSDSPCRGTY